MSERKLKQEKKKEFLKGRKKERKEFLKERKKKLVWEKWSKKEGNF